MPSSRSVGRISASTSRDHSEYSVCTAAIGWTACARRIVSGARLAEPDVADLALADELGHRADRLLDRRARGRCGAGSRGRRGRCPDAAASPRSSCARSPASRRCTRRVGLSSVGAKRMPNFVAIVASSRRPAIALPTSSSFVCGPYISAVSSNVQPSSSARSIVASASASSRRAVEGGHPHAAEAHCADGEAVTECALIDRENATPRPAWASLGRRARRAEDHRGARPRHRGARPGPAGRARARRRHVDPVRRGARRDAVRRRRAGAARRCCASASRRSCSSRSGARGCAAHRARAPAPRRRSSALALGADEPDLLRGARPHPARHRGDDRVPRADRGRDAALAPARWTSSGSRSRRRASCCSRPRGRAAGSTPVGVVFALIAAAFWAIYIVLAAARRPRLRRRRGARDRDGRRPRSSPLVPGIAAGRRGPARRRAARARRSWSRCCQLGDPLLAGDRGAAAHARATSSACS